MQVYYIIPPSRLQYYWQLHKFEHMDCAFNTGEMTVSLAVVYRPPPSKDNCSTIHGLHEELQSAYHRFHSTETALLKVQSDILESLDNGFVTVLVMLDLSASFDTLVESL